MRPKQQRNNKRKLIVNIFLLVFTFLVLVIGVVAWFANNPIANIHNLESKVERQEINLISEITEIRLPCATKIGDTQTTPTFFNTDCIVVKDYLIENEGKLIVSVDSTKAGLLGYVCDSSLDESVDYYTIIKTKLTTELQKSGKSLSSCTFDELQTALDAVNHREVGDFVKGNTKVRIVFWGEYDQFEDELLKETYIDLDFDAKITFVG